MSDAAGVATVTSSATPALRRWRFANALLDGRTLELTVDGAVVELERKPLQVLQHLLEHAGDVVTKDELLAAVWPGRILSETVLTKCVARLREVLADDQQTVIKTVYGYGYRFVAPVSAEISRALAPAHFDFKPGDHPPLRPLWSLVRRLGTGGHGEAWLVRHDKTKEYRVFKFALDEFALAALKREITLFRLLRDALGDKARIVTLLDWNLEQPPYFIESDYAVGGSLTEWAANRGGAGSVPLAVRIEIVAQIADALAAVHSVGVLHKDLKPSNVLVESADDVAAPTILLGDLGSGGILDAVRLEALGITRLGFTQTINVGSGTSGTPLYFAPELLTGQPPTVQADIYALGVLLYQMVVGDLYRPLTAGWEREVEDELLRADVAAAAEGNPEHRLVNAADLARRLRSLEARRAQCEQERKAQQKAETAKLAAERMRARRAALVLALVTMAVGLVTSTWLYFDARTARARAEKEAARAQAVADFLGKDLFSTVNSGQRSVKDLTAIQILDAAAPVVDKRFSGQPEAAAEIHESIGRSYLNVNQPVKAAIELEKALALFEQTEGLAGSRVVRVVSDLVNAAYVAGTLSHRFDHFKQIVAASEKRWGTRHSDVFRGRMSLARAHQRLGHWQTARAAYREILNDAEGVGPTDPEFVLDVRKAWTTVLLDLGEWTEAETSIRALLHDLERAKGATHFDVGITRARLGRLLHRTGRLDAAEAELVASLNIVRKWGDEGDTKVQTPLLYQGQLRLSQGRLREGISILESCLAAYESWHSAGIDQSGENRRALAAGYRADSRLKDAEAELARALAVHEKALGSKHPWTRAARVELAEVSRQLGLEDKARRLLLYPDPVDFEDLPAEHPFAVLQRRLAAELFEPAL